jgi:hypothetical protein
MGFAVSAGQPANIRRRLRQAQRRIRPAIPDTELLPVRGLRGRNILSCNVPQGGQFFVLLRRIVVLRNEKERKNGPLWRIRSRDISTAQTPQEIFLLVKHS